jgi:hypothetical protein
VVKKRTQKTTPAAETGLLTKAQLREFNAQNRLLKREGEEPLTVAEYLKCRLDDATGGGECPF